MEDSIGWAQLKANSPDSTEQTEANKTELVVLTVAVVLSLLLIVEESS